MVAIRLEAYVDEHGQLIAQIPDDFPRDQKVELEIRVKAAVPAPPELTPEEEAELDREIEAALTVIQAGGLYKTGAEIADWIRENGGGWEHKDITDPVAWLEEQRQQRRERKLREQR